LLWALHIVIKQQFFYIYINNQEPTGKWQIRGEWEN